MGAWSLAVGGLADRSMRNMRSRVEMVNGGRGGDRIGTLGGYSVELYVLRDGVNVEKWCGAWAAGCFMCDDVVFAP